jgi:hypothetical protein
MRSFIANCNLIGCAVLWVIGVDSMPFMKVLGLPLVILAFANWVKHSDAWAKLSNFMDNGLEGKYNE